MRVANDITELIGNTPLVKLNKLSKGLNANILVKLECFNPSGSVKARAAYNMIKEAETTGKLKPNSLIIEATSGNTGVALATIAAAKGYRLVLVIPDTMSIDKINYVKALGAEVILTPGVFGMRKAFAEARTLLASNPDAFMPDQVTNPANPSAHKQTADEIWTDTDGKVDIFIAGAGTGGTITGVGEALKSRNPSIRIVCVEPAGSPMISEGKRGPHKIQGIGPGFIPDILNVNILDEVIQVSDENAINTARNLARQEGIFSGISAGASVYAALEVANRKENANKTIVALLADIGERYLNTELYNESINNVFVS